ncbi:glucose 1-dehydrogenase [Skermanella mucosa]|uniref:SDR family NAD(P)-dependent oxidoreductase n=1 Tax=Skermanella mucosa TaxID=1789672 RepID=UPI00192AADCC|nr:glucose 1-dehydrogenase [Skermanella mucosa]UEM23945.1 glucose 1-dehydrogenase [Skermanella mucosa]
MSSTDLSGHIAFVTGASGGLGRHFAITLARAGAKVALAARRPDALKSVAQEIEGFDGRAIAVPLDVTDAASVRAAVEAAETELGPITVLVNNSGVTETVAALDQDEESWDRVIDTNLKGAWLVATEVARHMVRLGHGGSIINIASILGLRQGGQVTAYATSKAALVQLTKQLALELARYQIRVNALAPGYIETDINRDFFGTDAGKALIRRIPQRRLGQASDLDGPLLLLASDGSRYMTGSVLAVDGGHLVGSL